MKSELAIDPSHSTTTARPVVRGLGEQSHKFIASAIEPRTQSDQALPDVAALEHALAVGRDQLRAALSRIDFLEADELLLRHQVALLQRTVARERRFAYHDALTGLPNRRLLLDRYRQAVALAARQHRLVALLFLDLDGFKNVNDAHGHAVGDRILQQVAARLKASIRASDTACRHGGDEFVVLLPELETPGSALAAVRKIRTRLSTPYVIDGTEINVPASIGAALYPVDGLEYDELLGVSDGSMYRAKAGCARAQRRGDRTGGAR